MSSLFDGTREANYRERSNNASMATVALGAAFVCAVCHQARKQLGRKAMVKGYSRAGYKCASCVALSAARTADKTVATS